MSKKILFITPKIPYPPIDGHKKSMFGIIRAALNLGFDVTLICYSQNEKIDVELEKLCKVFSIDVTTKNSFVDAIKNIFSHVPYNLSKYERKELIDFLNSHLEKNTYDLIQVVNAHMGWIVDYLRSRTNAKIILREENLELSIMEKYYQNQKNPLLKIYAWIQYRKFLKYEPELCAKFDKCFMISSKDEKKLLAINPSVKTTVMPVGVDNELFSFSKKNINKFSIFHIGSLNWYPNLDGVKWFLEEIFPLIVQKEPLTKFYLYGSELPKNFLLKNEIKNNVVIKGFVENIWDEISDKQIAIVPLKIGSGLRVKILELVATSNIVVSTSIGAEGIGLKPGEQILIADSPESFAEEIINLFSEQIEINNIVNSAKEFVEKNYSWNIVEQKLNIEYKNLLN